MAMFYMQYKDREKAAKVVELVAKWLKLCLSTVGNISVSGSWAVIHFGKGPFVYEGDQALHGAVGIPPLCPVVRVQH